MVITQPEWRKYLSNTELQQDDVKESPNKKRADLLLTYIKQVSPNMFKFVHGKLSQVMQSIRLKLSEYGRTMRRKLSELTLSQWLYTIAFVLLLNNRDQELEPGSDLVWVGLIAGIGLSRELWHVFNRVWEKMLGKALILVLYAATANFALAVSAVKINAIAGIEPSPFIFTLGFATLIMLPFWLLLASIAFFSVALIAANLWLIISVLLRVIRVKVKVHWEDQSFVFLTMLLRLLLIPYVIMSILFMAMPYAEQIELFDHPMALVRQEMQNNLPTTQNLDTQLDAEVIDDAESEPDLTINVNGEAINLFSDQTEKSLLLDKLIASFIFQFETYPKSACKKAPQQRSLLIDENIMLLVEEDESELGYHFSVGPCVGNFEATAPQL